MARAPPLVSITYVSPPEGPPVFTSWADYVARTTEYERTMRCRLTAKRANRKRLLSAEVATRLAAADVWAILEGAKGRCLHCKSLAVEHRPSGPLGQPMPWECVGRRIGSLEHLKPRIRGGGNERDNLAWACLWCNTWPKERHPFAPDHGGLYPPDSGPE